MPDLTAARSPPAVTESRALSLLPPEARYLLRGAETARAAAEAAFGVAVPTVACHSASRAERSVLWLGPDEWLLLAPEVHSAAVAAALGAALSPLPHSLVEVSHRQCALHLSGSEAEALLAAGCPLDLDASVFPVGHCTRTLLAKAEVILWRIGAHAFRIEVARSLVAYVSLFLAEAARALIEGDHP